MSLRSHLALFRPPNLFTAAADPLAGWLLASGTLRQPGAYGPLMLASIAIYAGGITLNDLLDLAVDREERPERPLPSRQVSVGFARIACTVLLGLGPALAAVGGGSRSTIAAIALVGCVIAYDAAAKHVWLGPFFMGACRGLSMLVGLAAVAGPLSIGGFCVACAYAVFVSGLTWISRSETGSGRSKGLWLGAALQLLGLVGIMLTSIWQPPVTDSMAVLATIWPGPLPGISSLLMGFACLLTVLCLAGRATIAALRDPVPELKQRAVKLGILSLIWLNAGTVAAVRGIVPGLAVASLYLPARLLARRHNPT